MEAISVELLMAVAGGTAGAAGQQAWQSLRTLVMRRPEGDGAGGRAAAAEAGGQAELTALAGEPGSSERAGELAAALAERAGREPGFARQLETWRQKAEAVRGAQTGAGDVHSKFSGTANGPVIMGRDFNAPINFG
ncbi:hypothetical protein J7E95_26900 [Streptomyces sp. ISL-14]|nr:hypothetical protein [Streptomyces sp. ISL-14]